MSRMFLGMKSLRSTGHHLLFLILLLIVCKRSQRMKTIPGKFNLNDNRYFRVVYLSKWGNSVHGAEICKCMSCK